MRDVGMDVDCLIRRVITLLAGFQIGAEIRGRVTAYRLGVEILRERKAL